MKLIYQVTKFRETELLPLDPEECADHGRRQYCFAAGEFQQFISPNARRLPTEKSF